MPGIAKVTGNRGRRRKIFEGEDGFVDGVAAGHGKLELDAATLRMQGDGLVIDEDEVVAMQDFWWSRRVFLGL